MGTVAEDIKSNTFKNLYLLWGEEAYLRNLGKNRLKYALVQPGDNLNYSYFEGASINIPEIMELIETLPFLAEHKVIILENTGLLAKSSSQEEGTEKTKSKSGGSLDSLYKALSNIPEENIVIWVEEKIDKRSKFVKLFEKNGCVEECKKRSEDYLASWVAAYAKHEGYTINAASCAYLVSEVGTDMYTLVNEMDKLMAWALDRKEITIRDIDNVCTQQVNGKIFEMISAISEHRQKDALKMYYDLLTLRESPFHILALLTRQYNQLLEVRDLVRKDVSAVEIARKLSMQDWLAKKLYATVKRMKYSEIRANLEACAKADEDIKSGNISDVLSIELLIVACSNAS